MNETTIDPGLGYRLLVPGKDVVQDGDELFSIGEWVSTSLRPGTPVSGGLSSAYRRRIKPIDSNLSALFCKWADGRMFDRDELYNELETAFTAGFLAGENSPK